MLFKEIASLFYYNANFKDCILCKDSYKLCTHPHLTTPTHTHPHSPTLAWKTSDSPTETHTHQHLPTSSQKRSHSPTPTHTQPKKGHTHPYPPTLCQKGNTHPPTPRQKMSYLPTRSQIKATNTHIYPRPATKWSHPPTNNWKKECHVSNTWYIPEKYSLFTILAGCFIF